MNVATNNDLRCTIALASLHDVLDPEIGLNVVDLGLIYQLNFEEDSRKIFALMTLTTQFCPMGQSIADGVKNNLSACFPGYDVELELVFDPPWNHEMISEEGQNFLNR
ncbi:FeS assembly SUF system protein SufT [Chitinophaga alhagiae]|uniref:FeS assembly SUF system protein SufT n=1 Tax=Chitinophaga alhagiae TaxID=2203219 RepID=A0ABM6W8V3_9BACT|nr:metal-sulfur cluster assembly factor [Chitinophaga alhagiae]AWO00363.1 FeS assembly SUF system protein SufT [Chitinophaga alhagiae]